MQLPKPGPVGPVTPADNAGTVTRPWHDVRMTTTVTVSAAVSAVVSVVIGSLLKWGERVISWIRRVVPPDHRPLRSSTIRVDGADHQVNLLVCCAPNRSLRHKEIDPGKAIRLVHQQFPGLFQGEPEFSMPWHGVSFAAGGDSNGASIWVYASGCIALRLSLPTTPNPVTISIADLVQPLLTMRETVRSPAYKQVFGARLPGLGRRFDWGIAVSPTVSTLQGQVSWEDLVFPGRRPQRAGTDRRASCPSGGFAAGKLNNWSPRRSSADLVQIFLKDFLQQNGFHDVEPAIQDTLRALRPGDAATASADSSVSV